MNAQNIRFGINPGIKNKSLALTHHTLPQIHQAKQKQEWQKKKQDMIATVFWCCVAMAARYIAYSIGNGNDALPVTKLQIEMTDCVAQHSFQMKVVCIQNKNRRHTIPPSCALV